MIDIQRLRQQIRSKRAKLSEAFQKQAAIKVTNSISDSKIFKNSKHIALYIPVQGEMDPRPLMEYAWQENKTCYLPVLTNNHKLLFAEYKKNDPLINNRYNIPEPCPTSNKFINPENLDIAIIPVVAFDPNGNRLGTGAGYYDRTFAFTKQFSHQHKPYLIGIAYEFQKIAKLTPRSWDIPLDIIITEQTLFSIAPA